MTVAEQAPLSVTAVLATDSSCQGAPGVVHGGVLAAALDEAMGMVVWSLGAPYVTARLETDFVLPVPVGSVVRLTATCAGVRGRKAFALAEGRLDDGAGPVAVRAASLYLQVMGEPQ